MEVYLITGGAGFIGSHLTRAIAGGGGRVRVLDDFSTGRRENLAGIESGLELVEGDVRDRETVRRAMRGARYVLHHAALASVPRSIEDPITTDAVNVGGTLHLLAAAREEGVKRFVFASSSSVYGDSEKSPKSEEDRSAPLSPYAVSKRAGELYGHAFHKTHGLPFVALR